MSPLTSRLPTAAFAGFLLWVGGAITHAATAVERDGALSCGIVSPRYEPQARPAKPSETVKYPGGAKLRRPVADPCPRAHRGFDA